MAGDWIKMRTDLHTHPKVVRISSALRADRLRVVGGLHAVWCLFDAHSMDGRLDGYSPETLDEMIGFPGFASAMASVGWLIVGGDCLETPRFDEHNGQSAKRRAMEAERKRNERKLSASDADKKRSREEKRREEKEEEAYASVGGEAPADLVEPACSTLVEGGPHCDPMATPAAGGSIATAAPSSCPAEAIIELYHLHMPDNPRCKTLNDARRRAIRARWREAAKLSCKPFGYDNRADGLKAWAAFFEVCADSDFLTGKAQPTVGKPPFIADIDFLMSPSGFAKTLENKYHREVAA